MSAPMKTVLIVGLVAIPLFAGCSAYNAAHDYNAPTPAKVIQPHWTRFETPGNFPSLIFSCHGTDGVYVAMDNASSAEVVREDPNCGGKP